MNLEMMGMAKETEDFKAFMKRREVISTDYINGKPDGLLALSAKHGEATFFPPSGDRIHGASHVNAANEKGAHAFGEGSTGNFEILQSASSGDLGFWTGIQHAEVMMKGQDKPVSMQLRTTEVFRRENGDWKLVHRHADMPGSEKS
jgi:ketosteroid isomerase-like protein